MSATLNFKSAASTIRQGQAPTVKVVGSHKSLAPAHKSLAPVHKSLAPAHKSLAPAHKSPTNSKTSSFKSHRSHDCSSEKSYVSSVDEPILFPCVQCGHRLPTKTLANGKVVKKWDDDSCQTCWQADEILNHRKKFGLTDRIVQFLEQLKPNEIRCLVNPYRMSPEEKRVNDFLYGELIYELSYGNDDDWMARADELIKMLAPIKADRMQLAIQLHRRLVNAWW